MFPASNKSASFRHMPFSPLMIVLCIPRPPRNLPQHLLDRNSINQDNYTVQFNYGVFILIFTF
ncbi:hypothetical protein HA50_09680 [Pantoea cypripedii]|uniref:Uncharacterized protein n=1 Tax=Pantoea cypripedii TaxID=55209 RepID=A0A1X1EUI1_PANCY|nr:hypothetical protein HA50_09680 [Pantoea cypripedii]